MAFNKFGNALSVRRNVAAALSLGRGDRIIVDATGRIGSVVETNGLSLSVLLDGDDTPSTVLLTEVRKGA